MPAEQAHHDRSDAKVEQIIGRRESAFDKYGEEAELQRIGDDRDDHGGAKLRTGRNSDLVVRHRLDSSILNAAPRLLEMSKTRLIA